MPRVIIGSPLFNHASHFRESIEAILNQTFTDFALVLVDDGSTDATGTIAREYEALDSRVSYCRNEARLGLIDNSRKAFALARQRHPEAEYFAWTSDHDLCHPYWLQRLVEALDACPDAVLAYPMNRRIGPSGEVLKRKPWTFDTVGIESKWTRLSVGIRHMRAGNMVYGLFRVGALQRAGVYRKVVVPDRLLFGELSLYGQFTQVPQVLWFRRWNGRVFSLGRQRASFFPDRRPLYSYLPVVDQPRGEPVLDVHDPRRGATGCLAWRRRGCCAAVRRIGRVGPCLADVPHRRFHARRMAGRRAAACTPDPALDEATGEGVSEMTGKKKRAKISKRAAHLGFEAIRRPGLWFLSLLRAVPVVRNRVIPSLLKEELDEIPAAPAADAIKRELERLQKTSGPLLIGPWVGEVGFELLYWIPFLNWALKTYQLDRRRLIVVSRGGAGLWYRHLPSEYVDVFSLFSLDEYRQANEARWDKAGHQKQYRIEQMDHDIVERAKSKLGVQQVELLHPSLMYRLLRFYWFEKAGVGLLKHHTDYRRLAPVERSPRLKDLPNEYVAVRFYFRPSFPDTPENRRFAADIIRNVSREIPVVLLNTGLRLDDHEDLNVPGMGVHHVDRLMALDQNLEVQTEIISHARAFVGTYGGLAYLGPFYGVPSVSFYSTEAELVPAHLEVSWRLGQAMGVSVAALHTRVAGLIGSLLGGSVHAEVPAAPQTAPRER